MTLPLLHGKHAAQSLEADAGNGALVLTAHTAKHGQSLAENVYLWIQLPAYTLQGYDPDQELGEGGVDLDVIVARSIHDAPKDHTWGVSGWVGEGA